MLMEIQLKMISPIKLICAKLSEQCLPIVNYIFFNWSYFILDVFPNVGSDITSISKGVVQYIDCPGDDGETEVCAANTGSFANPNTWYIFLDGQSMRINDKPKYELSKETPSS